MSPLRKTPPRRNKKQGLRYSTSETDSKNLKYPHREFSLIRLSFDSNNYDTSVLRGVVTLNCNRQFTFALMC